MNSMLAVSQGSARPPRLVVMRWNGGRRARRAARLRRQGRGVRHRRHLDQAGRRHGGHEGRHGRRRRGHRADARARRRKAKVNAVGVIGLVENMPSGTRHAARRHRPRRDRARPSRSSTPTPRAASCSPTRSGTRRKSSSPRCIVDLATLTGAIGVALGHDHAGLFSNNDELAAKLIGGRPRDRRKALAHAAGPGLRQADREPLRRHQEHRRPRRPARSPRRSSSRASSATCPGRISTSPASRSARPTSETNAGWAPGFGVTLLDRFVRDNYESRHDRSAVLPPRAPAARTRAAAAAGKDAGARLAGGGRDLEPRAGRGARRAALDLSRRQLPAARHRRRRADRRASRC